jgi:hypothetical protein
MKVHLTFDVEVWCSDWATLDERFPRSFERYVYGRSAAGDYALPKTLEILNRFGLRGVFFIEPLFSARFGAEFLARIVRMIEDAGQEVQLHLHPEWTDEISPPPIAEVSRKRQHLCYYSREEQTQLLAFGLELLQVHVRGPVSAFRAGSYAANRDTYMALASVGIAIDSSLNRVFDVSASDVEDRLSDRSAMKVGGVQVYPVTVFRDGLGRSRPAQVNACGLGELRFALNAAHGAGRRHFVIVSHNFELLKPDRSDPDWIVVRRFEGLCRFLAEHRDRFDVGGFAADDPVGDSGTYPIGVPAWATAMRVCAQAARRVG